MTRTQLEETAAAVAAEKPMPADRSTLGATPCTSGRLASNVLYCNTQTYTFVAPKSCLLETRHSIPGHNTQGLNVRCCSLLTSRVVLQGVCLIVRYMRLDYLLMWPRVKTLAQH